MKQEEVNFSYVAQLFEVSDTTVKKWNDLFGEFLSSSANSAKEQLRIYSSEDIRVLALVADCRDWNNPDEDEDYSDIYYSLNSGEQHSERYREIAHFSMPLFQEVPSDVDETWKHGFLLGGFTPRSGADFARAYKRAGDILVREALASGEPYELTYPILYNYRHALELYLKVVVQPDRLNHNLDQLVNQLKAKYQKQLSSWSQRLLDQFHELDRSSTTFRYGQSLPNTELWVDLHQLQTLMEVLFKQLEQLIESERGHS